MMITPYQKMKLRFMYEIAFPFIRRDFSKLESISKIYIANEIKINSEYHETLAYSLKKQNKYDACINEYVFIIRHFPDNYWHYYLLIKFLYKTAKYQEVIMTSKTFLSLSFRNYDYFIINNIRKYVYWYAGYSAFHLGQFSTASEYLEKYVKCKRI